MNVVIKYDKLYSTFETMMEEYSHLDYAEKSYDYWVQEKGDYVEWDVLNFYLDIEDGYEDDDWILQYQDSPGDEGNDEDLPILRYGNWSFKSEQTMFGKYFEELLKDWVEKVYKLEVKTVEKI